MLSNDNCALRATLFLLVYALRLHQLFVAFIHDIFDPQ